MVLPLARAAAVSTGLRVREGGGGQRARRRADGGRDARVVVRDLEQSRAAGLAHLALYGEQRLAPARLAARRDQLDGVAAWLRVRVRVRVRVKVRVRVRVRVSDELDGVATLGTHARLQVMLEDVHAQRRVLRREGGGMVART